jgi:hypothetical protein
MQMAALLVAAAVLLGIVLYLLFRGRQSPAEKEKRRRLMVNQEGRIGDATITDVHDNIVFYEYSVRGVQYTASQDISLLREHIPIDPERLIVSWRRQNSCNHSVRSNIYHPRTKRSRPRKS